MKITCNAKVLAHKKYTGVENYTEEILSRLPNDSCLLAKPRFLNKLYAHFWTHFILPFQQGNVLFCPSNIAPLFIPKSKKLIVTIHDLAYLQFPDNFSFLFKRYYHLFVPFTIKQATTIITVSHFSKEQIIRYFPDAKDKIEVISLGCSEIFKQVKTTKKPQALFVGTLSERKNLFALLQIFDQITQYSLVVVGNMNANFRLSQESLSTLEKARRSDNIHFVQTASNGELAQLYNESTLLILPSFYEGFGMPLLEAMSCGTPVLCSNVASLPEVGADAAMYCDPYDMQDMQDKILTIFKDKKLQKTLTQKGLERVKQFSWERSAKRHWEIFEQASSL